MFFADCGLDLFTKGDVVDLYKINKCLVFSNFSDLSVNGVSNSNIETLDGEFVLDII